MGGNSEAKQLAAILRDDEVVRASAFAVECGPTGGVVVSREAHARGVWHVANGLYLWTPAGYSAATFETKSLAEAIAFTRGIVSVP